ncbi:MAG TPA: glycoside hydrolase family 3 N-terminal domain-containing protein [Geminicoccaceae bacterium]|nr:glycoside hydrolase family 3 N-terminal domain-containing protein [Geminicoccaceae bacterium]
MAGRFPSTRIEALLARMTLDEKIGQMTLVSAGQAVTGPSGPVDYVQAIRSGGVGTVSNLWDPVQNREVQRIALEETRLGIPLLFVMDVIHGHNTVFPLPLAEVGAFDPDLWRRTARIAATEAAASGLAMTYAPMLDIARDPRWGRIAESPGEDPWLAARFAEAKVQGFQGDDLAAADSLAATAKHLAAYGAVTAGRDYATVDVSDRSFHEIYLPPFRAAVAAGVAAIMPAFHDLAGVPMTANAAVLRAVVRERWGFEGVMVSDYGAVAELIVHGVAADIAEAAALALRAGVDIDLMGNAYARGLPAALERGRVTIADIDAAVRRILALKDALGLFEDPYRRGGPLSPTQLSAHRDVAREAARRAIVLLTHRSGVLPLAASGGVIAVLGPLADARADMLGPWAAAGRPEDMVGMLEGLRGAFADREIRHARGVEIGGGDASGIPAAVDLARAADVVVLCLGEARAMSGEAASRARPDLPGRQPELAKAVLDLGKPVVVVLSSGRPIMAPWLFERADAVLATWFLGSEAGHAVGDVLSGRHNPSGRLPVSWPVEIGQIPIFYARRPSGRPADPAQYWSSKYLDLPVDPLFPFGHGLSYTRFAYRDLRARPQTLRPRDSITVEVDIANEGAVAGEDTVFLFIHDPLASLARPLMELRGVAKITLDPGAHGTVTFTVGTDDLAFLGPDLAPRLEAGAFEIYVGPSAARESLLVTTIELVTDERTDAVGPARS